MIESPLVDSGLAVLVFSPRDDPIACLSKAMSFIIVVAFSRFPSTNNQLRTSSNLRNQNTLQDGRDTVQLVQGRQCQSYSGTGYKSNATSSGGNNLCRLARVVKCYNCQGEEHMARQCSQPKQPRNATWYKEKAMLAEAQEAGQILDEEKLAFLTDSGVSDGQAIQTKSQPLHQQLLHHLNKQCIPKLECLDRQGPTALKMLLLLVEIDPTTGTGAFYKVLFPRVRSTTLDIKVIVTLNKFKATMRETLLKGLHQSKNSSVVATQQLSSGNSSALTVVKCSSSGIFIASSGNAYEHFIPNNPPLNLMLHLQSSFQNQMLI
nr:hypothetical protein [Tanacetum cinerariifolium]